MNVQGEQTIERARLSHFARRLFEALSGLSQERVEDVLALPRVGNAIKGLARWGLATFDGTRLTMTPKGHEYAAHSRSEIVFDRFDGDPHIDFGDDRLPPRFWDKVIPEPNTGCLIWIGASGRYGHFAVNWIVRRAHRVAFQACVGEIPDGLELDHKCRVTYCVNPAHLEPVPHIVNVRRGHAVDRPSICKAGLHAMIGDNVRTKSNGRRICRACHRPKDAAKQKAKRARLRGES